MGAVNGYLEIFLSRNQFQLATTDALYSDGDRYRPAIVALDHLKGTLPAIKQVLILGAGLGSMIRAMRRKGYHPSFTLVDNDKVVLNWAIEFLDDEHVSSIMPVCIDAQLFIEQNKAKYDLVFIDIFNGRAVPRFVSTAIFLQHCLNCINPGGHLVFNYIINDTAQWESVKHVCDITLPGYKVIDQGINRIIVANNPLV